METFIVRIYRFQKDNPHHLVGIAESVEDTGRTKRAFTNLDELWEILNPHQMSETVLPRQGGDAGEVKASTPAYPINVPVGQTMKVIVDARRVSRAVRVLLTGHAIQKVVNGEIVVLADDEKAREEISHTARNHGWVLKGIESGGDRYRITLSKQE